MKRKFDIVMDKPITAIVLLLIVAMFMMLAVACNQPIEEDAVEPIKHQGSGVYKVVPLVVIHDGGETMDESQKVEKEQETNLAPVPTDAPSGEGIYMTLKAYAYCPCVQCCGKDDGITATGTQATPNRTIAVDPSVIPYGSRVVIDGNVYVAEDCGGDIKGYTIDVFHTTHQEALQWGIKYVDAVVYPAEEVTK